jgi:hypothetical protein
MKKLLISLICTICCITLFAQTDSSNSNTMNTKRHMGKHYMNTTGSMKNSSISNGMMGAITIVEPKASLPVYETYIAPDIIANIKQKISGGDQVYDITAVKAPMDSSMMNNNAAATTTNNSSNNMAATNNSMSMTPQSWDYVVRVLKNGAITTKKVDGSGNPVN